MNKIEENKFLVEKMEDSLRDEIIDKTKFEHKLNKLNVIDVLSSDTKVILESVRKSISNDICKLFLTFRNK